MIGLSELEPVFREVFDDPSITLSRDTTANDVEGWDSLTHVNLVMALELRFGIRFALGELQSLRNVGEMADVINRKVSR